MERLVVIGGDAAGMSAASQARRRRSADDLEIIAFERGNYTSYSACGIPYFVGGVVDELDELIVRRPETFKQDQDIDVRIRHEVTDVDTEARSVVVRDLAGGRDETFSFDTLMVATGAVPIRPPLPESDAKGIFGIQTLDDGLAIFNEIEDRKPTCAVVIGGGYIGLEMAEAFARRELEVTLIEAAHRPMSTLDADMGDWVTDALRDLGIQVLLEEPVVAFERNGDHVAGVVTAERTIPSDIVVLGIGVRPNIELAERAGLTIGPSGAVEVDQRMSTSAEGVWSGGDCAEKFDRVLQKPTTIALGTHANKEGRVAGINIGGGYATFPGVVGTAASKVCDLEVARTGLKETEAKEAGFQVITAVVDSKTRAGYFPGAAPIKTKLIVEAPSGRLLGAQIVGKEGAAKRIDVLATALWNEMNVEEILHLDLSYAPPFAPVWDPVLIAARKAWEKVEDARLTG